MYNLKSFLMALVSFVVLDLCWFGFIVKDFNLQHLSEIGRVTNGEFHIQYLPASLTYVLMATALVFFVLPTATNNKLKTFLKGALMGLVVYGVFDLTNLAILKNYPVIFAFADIAWGTFVFGTVTLITKLVARI